MHSAGVPVLVLLCVATTLTLSSAIPKPNEAGHKSSSDRIQEKVKEKKAAEVVRFNPQTGRPHLPPLFV